MGEGCVFEEGCSVEEVGFGEGFVQVVTVEEGVCSVGGGGVEGCCCIEEEEESFVRVISGFVGEGEVECDGGVEKCCFVEE